MAGVVYQMHNCNSFRLRDRIIGASRHSIQLKGDEGEMIFCSNKVFNAIVKNPDIPFRIVTIAKHEDPRNGNFYPDMKWIEAFIPTRFWSLWSMGVGWEVGHYHPLSLTTPIHISQKVFENKCNYTDFLTINN